MMISMRSAMAMIELIFAIVIIAISVITIPMMISVADNAAKRITLDDDIMSRLSGWTIDKFQARWDGNYSASGSGPLVMNPNTGDLRCVPRIVGSTILYRENNNSAIQCDINGNPPSVIPTGDGNITRGIEQLNGGSEPITITPAGGTAYNVTATYVVSYVDSTVAGTNTQTATWRLGSSTTMNPNPTGISHLKRVVTRFNNTALGVDTTITFFKSNKGN
jgi:hypothetical protein